MNLTPAYGKMRNSVAEWPWNSPRMPFVRYIRAVACKRPIGVPTVSSADVTSPDGRTGILAELGIGCLEEDLDPIKRCYCGLGLYISSCPRLVQHDNEIRMLTYHTAGYTAREAATKNCASACRVTISSGKDERTVVPALSICLSSPP